MRKTTGILITLLLAGCAGVITPKQLREIGRPYEATSKNAPADVARCLARNAEEYRPWGAGAWQANVRDASAPKTFEVLVTQSYANSAIADVTPTADGSHIIIWQHPDILFRSLSAEMAKGC